jgi:transposase
MTPALLALADWLTARGVTHVAMESTGSYWKPIWNLLEDQFTLLLVNAQHVKAVPGRKSDVKDCAWLAELLRHGLLQPSLVPDRAQRELRELTRYRTSLVRARSAEVNRLQKVLVGANIQLGSVVSDVTGVSARAMLTALVGGETDPASMDKLPALEAALTGRMGDHQRLLLAQHLAHIDFLETQIAGLSAEIGERLAPFEELLLRLDTIPGIGRWTAEVIVAEVGVDFTRFPDAAHLVSWAGLCPGQDQSAGKLRSRRTRKGSPWLRTALTEAAYAAGRTKQTAVGERYRRLTKHKGRKRAAIAVGRTLLELCYHLATSGATYHEPVLTPSQQRARATEQRRLIRQLERLGNRVIVQPLEAA